MCNGGVITTTCTQMHNMFYACFYSIVSQGLALQQHVNRITCNDKNAVSTFKGGNICAFIIKDNIEISLAINEGAFSGFLTAAIIVMSLLGKRNSIVLPPTYPVVPMMSIFGSSLFVILFLSAKQTIIVALNVTKEAERIIC